MHEVCVLALRISQRRGSKSGRSSSFMIALFGEGSWIRLLYFGSYGARTMWRSRLNKNSLKTNIYLFSPQTAFINSVTRYWAFWIDAVRLCQIFCCSEIEHSAHVVSVQFGVVRRKHSQDWSVHFGQNFSVVTPWQSCINNVIEFCSHFRAIQYWYCTLKRVTLTHCCNVHKPKAVK